MRRRGQKTAEKGSKIVFLDPFLGIFSTITKTVTYVKLCLALHHWWKFRTNLTWFGVVIHEKPPKSSQKYYFLLVRETLKCITWQPQMLWRWNLPGLCISTKLFICPKIWLSPIRQKRVWFKNFWIPTTKWGFWINFLEFSALSKNVIYVMQNIGLHYCSNFEKNLTAFGGVMAEKPSKSTQKWYFLLVGKHLNIDNLATTNAILVKFTTLMYLHETFQLAKI